MCHIYALQPGQARQGKARQEAAAPRQDRQLNLLEPPAAVARSYHIHRQAADRQNIESVK